MKDVHVHSDLQRQDVENETCQDPSIKVETEQVRKDSWRIRGEKE